MTVVVSKSPNADKYDTVFGQMFIAREYRWMLENMQESRRTGEESKVLPRDVIEKKLGSVLIASGEDGLNAYRDTLRETAERLKMDKEFQKINKLIRRLISRLWIPCSALATHFTGVRLETCWPTCRGVMPSKTLMRQN